MGKSRKQKRLRYYFLRLIGRRGQLYFAKLLANYKGNQISSVSFPEDILNAGKVLIILPEDPLEALHQVFNVVSLVSFFKKADIQFFCEDGAPVFFKNIKGVSSVISYKKEDRNLFSPEFLGFGKKMSQEKFDICFVLGRKPDIAVLYLVLKCGATARIGYFGSGDYPFINIHIKPDSKQRLISEQNMIISNMVGGKPVTNVHWVVAKDVVEEMAHMIQEYGIKDSSRLGGIDVTYCYNNFGEKWLQSLIGGLGRYNQMVWYLYIEGEPDESMMNWLKSTNSPVFAGLSSSRTAALIQRSDLIISGKSVFFELAYLLDKEAIGIFDKKELPLYCRSTQKSHGVAFSGRPDEKTKDHVLDLISSICCQ